MWNDLVYRLRALFGRAAVEAELDQELRFHLERQEEKYLGQGLSPGDARRRARLDFGGDDAVREACREARGTRWLEDLLQDLRYGVRALRRSPGFTAAAVLSLALGIGANCAIFTVLDALLLKTLPVEEPHRLLRVILPHGEDFNYPLWQRFRGRQDEPRKVHIFFNLVSPGYFQAVGTNLLRGRAFTGQDTEGSPKVAIANETAARELFPGVNPLGRTYRDRNAGGPYTVEIVGVARNAKYRRLRDPAPATVYVPIAQTPAPFPVTGTYELRFSGGLANVTARVRESVKQIDPRIAIEFRLLSAQVADSLLWERLLAGLAAGFAALALVLASVGVYGVVAYAVVRRRGEIGIRMAMGATRASVLRLALRDIASLLAAGLAIGTALVMACSRLVATLLYGLKPYDPLTLAAACAVLTLVAALAAYLPARGAAQMDPWAALREE